MGQTTIKVTGELYGPLAATAFAHLVAAAAAGPFSHIWSKVGQARAIDYNRIWSRMQLGIQRTIESRASI